MLKMAKHQSKKAKRTYEIKVICAAALVGALFCGVVWWFSGMREFVVGGTVFGGCLFGLLAWVLFAFTHSDVPRSDKDIVRDWLNRGK
ncbi:hypothetical protein EAH72_34495 [Pseudomonas caspiana]|nr:hypothetical protein [Pseudomonas caspiana]TPG86722.1 hypothetical protein EAH72_34495 [Pseudomonas caspiana]